MLDHAPGGGNRTEFGQLVHERLEGGEEAARIVGLGGVGHLNRRFGGFAEEVARIQKRMGVDEPKYKIELQVDDLVKINDGPLKGFEGKVTEVDDDKGKVKVSVSMFGRETPVTLDFLQVKKV